MNPSQGTSEFQGPPCPWLTGEEFLAQVEATRIAKLQAASRPHQQPRSPVRICVLEYTRKFVPQRKSGTTKEAA